MYFGKSSYRIAKIINTKIAFKTINKLYSKLNIIIENINNYNKSGVYKIKYNNCNKEYICNKQEDPTMIDTTNTRSYRRENRFQMCTISNTKQPQTRKTRTHKSYICSKKTQRNGKSGNL